MIASNGASTRRAAIVYYCLHFSSIISMCRRRISGDIDGMRCSIIDSRSAGDFERIMDRCMSHIDFMSVEVIIPIWLPSPGRAGIDG